MSLGLGLGLSICGGGALSGPATPVTLLSDVVCWLRSDKGWSVSQFTDQTAFGNSFVQATGANQPSKVAADVDFNGHDSWLFNGTSTFLNLTTFVRGTGADLFVWAVIKLVGAGSFPVFWGDSSALHELRGSGSTGKPNMTGNAGSVSSVWGSSVVGATKAIAGYDVAAGSPRVGVNVSNGSAVETATGAHANPAGSPVSLGARSPGTSLWANMKIAELVVATTMPSSAQLTALQTYATTTSQGTGYGSV